LRVDVQQRRSGGVDGAPRRGGDLSRGQPIQQRSQGPRPRDDSLPSRGRCDFRTQGKWERLASRPGTGLGGVIGTAEQHRAEGGIAEKVRDHGREDLGHERRHVSTDDQGDLAASRLECAREGLKRTSELLLIGDDAHPSNPTPDLAK